MFQGLSRFDHVFFSFSFCFYQTVASVKFSPCFSVFPILLPKLQNFSHFFFFSPTPFGLACFRFFLGLTWLSHSSFFLYFRFSPLHFRLLPFSSFVTFMRFGSFCLDLLFVSVLCSLCFILLSSLLLSVSLLAYSFLSLLVFCSGMTCTESEGAVLECLYP